ncbi:MAG TPA: flap endonuclease, partial [Candidatus Eisenbacteria bacterium]|nr:flap endonuclease [Candidatus Eisenbacteria bacterium]
MRVHLVDGTYELFRHFYGAPPLADTSGRERAAVVGVIRTLLVMLEEGATHLGVATDHIIESFRNDLYAGYKTGDGIDPRLWEQFTPLEEAVAALGVTIWAMVEVEADDALAAAAAASAADPRVEQVIIWTP